MPVLRWISRWDDSSIKSLRIRRTCNIVKALFAIVYPRFFRPKVLFMMLQIRPEGVAHFTPVCSNNWILLFIPSDNALLTFLFEVSRPEEFHLHSLAGRVENWRVYFRVRW